MENGERKREINGLVYLPLISTEGEESSVVVSPEGLLFGEAGIEVENWRARGGQKKGDRSRSRSPPKTFSNTEARETTAHV